MASDLTPHSHHLPLLVLLRHTAVLVALGGGWGACGAASDVGVLDGGNVRDGATHREAAIDSATPDKLVAKTEREGFVPYPNRMRSSNFVIKWGSIGNTSVGNLTAILNALEQTWQAVVTKMGYGQPYGTDKYLMNVYVAGTGVDQPPSYPGYAYMDVDPAGYPVLVFSRERTTDGQLNKSLNSTAHEFFHAVQEATGAYKQVKSSSWWFEATATWMAEEVFPKTFAEGYLLGLASYAFLPHLSLRHYEMPGQKWTLVQGHQYGAFVFCRFLTDYVADAKLLQDSWVSAKGQTDPLVVLDGLLTQRGKVLVEEFGRFAAHNAVWDYSDRKRYLQALEQMALSWGSDDHRLAVDLPSSGASLNTAPIATLPQHAGYNVIRLAHPAGSVKVTFQGDAKGSMGSPATFSVWTVVAAPTGKYTYAPVPLQNQQGTLSVAATSGDDVFLTVAAWSMSSPAGEVFSYKYALEIL